MYIKSVLKPIGDCSPFGFSAPNWPIAAAAGVNMLSTILTNNANAKAQQGANEINLQMQREANESNERISREYNTSQETMSQKNMEWLKEQFYKQREWSDPSDIVARLNRAGINPAFYFGDGVSASNVGSVGSPGLPNYQVPHMEAGHVEPTHYDFSGLGAAVSDSMNAFYENQLRNEMTKKAGYDTQIAAITASNEYSRQLLDLQDKYEEVQNKLASRGLTDSQKEHYIALSKQIHQQIEFQRQNWSELSRNIKAGNDYTVERTTSEQHQRVREDALARLEMSLKPALASANIRLSNAQIEQIKAGLPLIVQNIQNAIADGKLKTQKQIEQMYQSEFTKLALDEEKAYQKEVGNGVLRAINRAGRYLGETISSGLLRGLSFIK